MEGVKRWFNRRVDIFEALTALSMLEPAEKRAICILLAVDKLCIHCTCYSCHLLCYEVILDCGLSRYLCVHPADNAGVHDHCVHAHTPLTPTEHLPSLTCSTK